MCSIERVLNRVPILFGVCVCVSCVCVCVFGTRQLAGLEPEVRLWALDQKSTKERLEKGIVMLTERKNILAAKIALSSLNFD